MNISILLGKTLVRAEQTAPDELLFETTEGESYRLYHQQDCCESVSIEDINGSLSDLLGSPLTLADESSNSDDEPPEDAHYPESYTWTFYRLATVKGYVDIRWYGESNGYYSEGVDFEKVK